METLLPSEIQVPVAIQNKAVSEEKIPDDFSRQSISLTLANLFVVTGYNDKAAQMCSAVINGEDKQLKNFAYTLKDNL